MSFLTFVQEEATIVETAVVAGLKDGLNYVDNVLITELLPELEKALLDALKVMEQSALASFINAQSKISGA